MPETRFHLRWPDGRAEVCYSPSTVVKDHLAAGQAYALDEFVSRIRLALREASERVRAHHGFACSRAAAELARLEATAGHFAENPTATVVIERFSD